jgi:hypothetical protein
MSELAKAVGLGSGSCWALVGWGVGSGDLGSFGDVVLHWVHWVGFKRA